MCEAVKGLNNFAVIFTVFIVFSFRAGAVNKIPLVNLPIPTMISSSSTINGDERVRKNISILALINYSGPVFTVGTICTTGIQVALDQVRQSRNLLPGYNLMVEPIDDVCTRALAVSRTLETFDRNNVTNHRLPLMMGSLCAGALYSSQIIHHYNFAGVTMLTPIADISLDRSKYKHFYVLPASMTSIYLALTEFIASRGWRKVVMLSEVTPYWDMVEKVMLRRMDVLEITLQGLFKVPLVSGSLPEEGDINFAVEDLANVQPRIIVVNSNAPARVACFLHRYGLYGPDYVIFWLAIGSFLPNDPARYKWCSEEMLSDVLESSFVFGDSSKEHLPSTTDSSGMSKERFEEILKTTIDHPDSTSVWNAWRFRCYEMTMFAARWLNATETVLKSRNETLSDWVTSGDKFQRQGEEYLNTTNKALFSFRMNGLSGDYEFDETADDNARGFSPIVFSQLRKELATSGTVRFRQVPLAVANGAVSNISLEMLPNEIIWRTFDKMQPPDSIRIVQVLVPLIGDTAYAVMAALGALAIFTAGAFLVIQIVTARNCRNNKAFLTSMPHMNNVILLGDLIMAFHTLFLPRITSESVTISCSIAYFFMVTGSSHIFFGFYLKFMAERLLLCLALEQQMSRRCRRRHRRYRRKRRPFTEIMLSILIESRKKFIVAIGSWFMTHHLLCILWLTVDPLTSRQVLGAIIMPPNRGSSIRYQLASYECSSPNSPHFHALIGLISVLNGVIILRTCLLGYRLKSGRFRISDFKQTSICFYVSLISLFATGVLCTIYWQNAERLQLVLSACTFVLSFLNILAIFLPKVIKGSYREEVVLDDASLETYRKFTCNTEFAFRNQSPIPPPNVLNEEQQPTNK